MRSELFLSGGGLRLRRSLLPVGPGDLTDKCGPAHVHGRVNLASLRSRIILEDFHHQGCIVRHNNTRLPAGYIYLLVILCCILRKMVGAKGFEPSTSWSEPVEKITQVAVRRHLLIFGPLSDGQVGTSHRRMLARTLGN
jgi:hypothetical protein